MWLELSVRAGLKEVEQGEVRGENGVRWWGSFQATERPMAFMHHEVDTKEFEAEAFGTWHFIDLHSDTWITKNPFRLECLICDPIDIWGWITSWIIWQRAVLCIVGC